MKKNTFIHNICFTFCFRDGEQLHVMIFLDSEPLSKISPEQYFTDASHLQAYAINSTLTYYLHMVKEWGYLAMRVQTIK